MMRIRFSHVLAAVCLPSLAATQEATDAAASQQATLLKTAIAKMAELPAVTFTTIEAQDQALTRRFRGAMGGAGEVEISGACANGLVKASLNYDEDEVVIHGGRMVARKGDGAWKPRRSSLAGGQPLPFVFDPELFFEVAGEQLGNAEITCHETATYKGKEVVILGMTLEGKAAGELGMTGIVPGSKGAGMMMMGGMGGGAMPRPDVTTDLAVYVDPETKLIRRIRVKSYEESAMLGNVQFKVAGPGGDIDSGDEEPEEEIEEVDAQGKRIYKKGLPVRNLGKGTSLVDFDIVFSKHGETFTPELDDAARKMLRLK